VVVLSEKGRAATDHLVDIYSIETKKATYLLTMSTLEY